MDTRRDGKKMYADVLLLDVQSISRMEISGQGERDVQGGSTLSLD